MITWHLDSTFHSPVSLTQADEWSGNLHFRTFLMTAKAALVPLLPQVSTRVFLQRTLYFKAEYRRDVLT